MTEPSAVSGGAGPTRARAAVAVLLLLLLAVLFFPGAFSGGAFYYRDLFRVHHPAKAIGLEAASEGRLPWWSERHSLGQPFLADPNFTVFYPTNLFYLVLPFNTAFNLHVVLHVFLCGLFTLLLARRRHISWPPPLVAAGVARSCSAQAHAVAQRPQQAAARCEWQWPPVRWGGVGG